ncbi:MAG: hypothetical protein HFE74_04515 [Firmicutes bacterium]|jgi:hypothetical protein|nr:hypothetical protein [Bacillota bacterium]
MIKRFFKKKRSIDTFLSHFNGYAVESNIAKGTVYLADCKRCAVLRVDGYAMWDITETESVIKSMKPEIQEEAAEVFAEAIDWRNRLFSL